ncbi:hypothetical protein HaLaN_31590 [Haematococcus lacustris]|uniref:Uncharacterized protein n=1 Tax=Haematococcus lacustris TaxID=44745 RepID=A0A6A0AHE2_HAELA|nr:hypothetical protein HaLaN_31590 [Haematococcus lacustris]
MSSPRADASSGVENKTTSRHLARALLHLPEFSSQPAMHPDRAAELLSDEQKIVSTSVKFDGLIKVWHRSVRGDSQSSAHQTYCNT